MQDHFTLMYPIGKYAGPDFIHEHHISQWKETIRDAPSLIEELVRPLSEKELNYRYRENGWNIHQVVHHLSDSHTNAFIRFKLALTEDTPIVKPYLEGAWAELNDYRTEYLFYSLNMLQAVHAKWSIIMDHMTLADFHNKSYYHPENHKNYTLGEVLGLYDWHSKHHIAHIKQAMSYQGRFT